MGKTQPAFNESSENKASILFKVAFETAPDKPVNVTAYVFDPQGNLLAHRPLREGQAELPLNPAQLRDARIFFGPPLPEGRNTKITLDAMKRMQAYEPVWKFDPRRNNYEFRPIPDFNWRWWFWCACRVRGQVVKPVTIAGVTYDKPVCGARVHICEVDQLWWLIPTLPDPIIWRIRDELLKAIEFPQPIPLPDPPPFEFNPGVIDPSPENVARLNLAQGPQLSLGKFDVARVMLNPQPLPPKVAGRLAPGSTVSFNPQPDPPGSPVERNLDLGSKVMINPQPLPPRVASAQLSLETHSALLSNSLPVVRRALQDNVVLIRPWLCFWDWFWPFFCRCDEVAVLTTDNQGQFDTNIWYLCFGDHPDLYFWVEFPIGGVWTPVYEPFSVCCNTYWDYVCGSSVTLRVTDPRVPWCGDDQTLPGKQVAVLSIGEDISMTEIQRQSAGTSEGLTTTTFAAGDFALPVGDGTLALDTPLGGSLEPHVFFGEGLIPAGITHYRWSYRRKGSLDDFTAMDAPVIRDYAEELNDGTLTFKPFPLGPDAGFPGQNLFKIRPHDPPAPGGPVVSTSWAPEVDARQNTASAFFNSHLLDGGNAATAAGQYELKLELFKNVMGVMTAINFSDEGVALKTPTIDAPFGQVTVPTVDVAHFPAQIGDMEDRVIRDMANKIVAFRLVLHVDNNPSFGEIEEVSVNGHAAGDCGFITYTPGSDAVVSFIASHPSNFAYFSFANYKGSCGEVIPASAAGWVARATINGFNLGGGMFTKNVPVTDLLNGGTCGTVCIKAAFSENLYVAALATDGWNRLSYLDWSATPKAFALEP